jgi:hypothetical protein
MILQSLNCPNCGAPLRQPTTADLWLCVYCNSLIRVLADQSPVQASLERSLDASALEVVKQLVHSGKRQEAIDRYQMLSGVDLEQATRMIDQMAVDFSMDTIFSQQLTTGGIILVASGLLLLLFGLLSLVLGWLDPVWAVIVSILAVIDLLIYSRGALTTLRYWRAPIAAAETLHFAHIGAVLNGRMRVHTYKVVFEVRPKDATSFQAEAIIPVREENISRLRQGEVIQVKYLPGVPNSIIFHQT